jgi:hypothetical protein
VTFPPLANTKELNTLHPDFAANADVFADLSILYSGGNTLKLNASRFLRKRPKELGSVFLSRLNAVNYDNLLQSICSWYTAKLFENPLQIETQIPGAETLPTKEATFYGEFLKNADNASNSLEKFFEKLTADVLVYGKGYFLIDLPKLDVQPTNLQEQEDLGALNPYFVYLCPSSVTNWQLDRFGNYEWVLLHTVSTESSFLGAVETVERWSYYNKTDFAIYEARYEKDKKTTTANLVSTGRHALADEGKVPVRVITADDRLWLGNRVYLPLVEYFNTDCAYGFSLWLANAPLPVFVDGTDSKTEASQTVAEYASITLPKGGDFKFVEVEGKSFDSSQKRLDSLKDAIYRLCHLLPHGKTSKGSDYQSGVSKEVQMQPASDVLNVIGSLIRGAIEDALGCVAAIRGDGVVADVSGMNFAEDQAADLVNLVIELKALNIPSETFAKEASKKVVRTFLRDKGPALLQKCCDEVEAAPVQTIPEPSTVSLNVSERTQPE